LASIVPHRFGVVTAGAAAGKTAIAARTPAMTAITIQPDRCRNPVTGR
jgi:hypothetical protein